MHVYFPATSQLTRLLNCTQKKSCGLIGYIFSFVEAFLLEDINMVRPSNAQWFDVQHFCLKTNMVGHSNAQFVDAQHLFCTENGSSSWKL